VADHLATAALAVGLFIGTDIDDLIVLTMLFVSGRTTGRPRPWQTVAGQYAGIAALVLVSILAALGLSVVPDAWVALLGLIPVGLGVRGLLHRDADEGPPPIATGALSVAAVTVANGADNIAVYTPVFRTSTPTEVALLVVVFAVVLAAWCLVAYLLGSHPRVVATAERIGHWLVPAVFIVIGLFILTEPLR
jgi:cadmium resistance protein CadD (predicted permease)